jgi:hypothetical protein
VIHLLHLAGNVAAWVALAASVEFCGLYAVLAPWRRSAEGWHLMTFTATLALSFALYVYRQIIAPPPVQTLRLEVPRDALLISFAALMTWRLSMLIRTQVRRRRR